MANNRELAVKISRSELARQKKIVVGQGLSQIVALWQNGRPVAFSAVCPHLGGPLHHGSVAGNRIRCPWHAYEFDLDSGRCLSKPGQPWRKHGLSGKQQVTGKSQEPPTLRFLSIEIVDDELWIGPINS